MLRKCEENVKKRRRSRNLGIIGGMVYDLVVIGGGLLGVGIARDAALRGLSVCIFEQEDFGAGAAARGSRLVTGGLNALETLDFTRVREDIHERELLLLAAPHLVVPQSCLVPFYSHSLLVQTRLRASLALADALGFDQSLPVHQILSAQEACARAPSLRTEGLTGAALVWEAAVPRIERLALETALDARRHGAALRTHTRVETLCWESGPRGHVCADGVRWADRLTGERGRTQARLVVVAAGTGLPALAPWLQGGSGTRSRLLKSVSVLGAPLPGHPDALVFPREDEGRLLLALPRPGGSWFGSLETDFSGDSETVHATRAEVSALIHLVRDYLPEYSADAAWEDLRLAQAAVSIPLPPHAFSFGVAPPAYDIVDHGTNGGAHDGLLSVSGGRVSAVRSIAEEAVDLACRKLGRALSTPPCRTASTPLPPPSALVLDDAAHDQVSLVRAAEWAVTEEECRTLRDFLLRRSSLFWTADQGLFAAPPVMTVMASLLGWDDDRQARELKAYRAEIALMQAFRVL